MTINISVATDARRRQCDMLAARSMGHGFSERNVLLILSESVLSGAPIEPEFQALANAIMAKSIIKDRLPLKRKGAKKGSGIEYSPIVLTEQYFDLLDDGMSIGECELEIANLYKLDPRQVRRVVEENKWLFGDHKPARDQRRADPEWKGIEEPEADEGGVELALLEKGSALEKLQSIIGGV
ncbi:MAG: hypothetical protein ACRYGA_13485 [Janthinobacterium lividum]